MRLEILTIGGEILSGRIVDSNFLFLARRLARLGLCPTWHTSTLDHADELEAALAIARDRADGIITTGGLGATPDDLTRPALARAFDRELEFREDLWREIEARYAARGMKLQPISSAMARLPVGAEAIPNPEGVAPGILLRDARGFVIALPGVPREMEAITDAFVTPYLEEQLRARGLAPGREVVLRTAGVSETLLAEKVEPCQGAEIAYLPHWGGVDLRLLLPLGSRLSAHDYSAWVEAVRARLGSLVYGEGQRTLEAVIGDALAARGLTLGLAESLTAGGVASALVQVAGSSRYFEGGVVAYANEMKQKLLGVREETLAEHGAVSAACAAEMAIGARHAFSADLGLSTTGIAGPDGGSAEKPIGLVYFGLAQGDAVATIRRHFPGSREMVTRRAVTTALLLLHRHLAGIPLEGTP